MGSAFGTGLMKQVAPTGYVPLIAGRDRNMSKDKVTDRRVYLSRCNFGDDERLPNDAGARVTGINNRR